MSRCTATLFLALTAIVIVTCAGDRWSIAQEAQPKQTRVTVDISQASKAYSNYSRVTGTPEELVIDFGLNAQASGVPPAPIVIDHRVVMSYYTAKRLHAALALTLQRHEQLFGPIETDAKKRLVNQPKLGE